MESYPLCTTSQPYVVLKFISLTWAPRIILNNYGYTVERYFNGMEASYNDVPIRDYDSLFQAFSPEVAVNTFKVSKAAELDAVLADEKVQTATFPQVCSEKSLISRGIN